MPQRPQEPPPGLMIPELRTPCPVDRYYRVLINRDDAIWRENNPIKRGTLYSSLKGADKDVADRHPEGLYFISETVPIGSNTVAGMTQSNWVVWNFMTVPRAESATNAEVSFMGDSVSNPVYARVYTVRRDEYDEAISIATNTPFTGLIGLKKISGGQNYSKASGTLRGNGEDSDARVSFVIADGEVISGIVENEGEDFDLNSYIDVIGDGTGAQYQLILQPVGAVLTSQKKLEFPDDDPRQAEFVKVFRVYELLPGPYLPFTRYDDNLGPIQGRRRAVLNTGQQGGVVTNLHYLNYEARDGSSVVSWEVEERFSDGSGIPIGDYANPVYPTLRWSTYTDERGKVDHTSQLFGNEFAGHQATLTHPTPNTVLKTWFEPYADNPVNLVKKLTETWTEPAPVDQQYISTFGGGIAQVTETTREPGVQSAESSLMIVESSLKTINPNEQIKRTVVVPGNAWPILPGCHTDEKTGIVLGFTKQVIDAEAPVPPRSGYRGPFVEDTPYDLEKKIRIITAPDLTTLPGPEAWITTRQFSLPRQLLSVEAIWTDQNRYSAEAHTDTVSVYAKAGSRGGCLITCRNGFRGNAKCIVARDYKYGPFLAADIPTPFKIIPSSGSIVFIEAESTVAASAQTGDDTVSGTTGGNAFSTNSGMSMADFDQRVHEIDMSDMLVGNFSILNATKIRTPSSANAISGAGQVRAVGLVASSGPWNAQMVVRIPLSTPTPEYLYNQPNHQILVDVTCEEWGYGIWVMHRYYIDTTSLI